MILFTISIKHKKRKHFAPSTKVEKNRKSYSRKQKYKKKYE